MSGNRSVVLAGLFGCVVGAMIPFVLGAAQAPEPNVPHYSLAPNEHYLYVVDNRTDEMHLYFGAKGGDLVLHKTIDLKQIGEKKLVNKYSKQEEDLKNAIEQKNKAKAPATSSP